MIILQLVLNKMKVSDCPNQTTETFEYKIDRLKMQFKNHETERNHLRRVAAHIKEPIRWQNYG